MPTRCDTSTLFEHVEEGYADNDGVRIHYADIGRQPFSFINASISAKIFASS